MINQFVFMKITINQAWSASQQLQKKQLPTGQMKKPDILNAKGDAGMAVYFLKHSIKDGCSAEFERINDLLQEKQELLQKDDSKERIEEINTELSDIGQKEIKLELRSKIPADGIKNLVDVETLEALDFAIDFGSEQSEADQAEQ